MTFGTHRASANGRRLMGIALLFFCWLGLTRSADGQDLGSAELHIAGTQLEISPAAQTVPFDTPTLVTTRLSGYDTTLGTLPPGLSVVGDLVGPEINGGLRLETSPGEPFRIPRLRLKGDYTLKDIRLEQDGELLAYGEPREATVSVTRILITSVSATAMTEEEMRSYGLVIGDGNYQAFNLSFALGLLDRPIQEFVVPVVYELYGHGLADGTAAPRLTIPTAGQSGTVTSRFQPPSLTPFRIDLLPNDRAAVEVPRGGCDIKQDPCRVANPQPPPMVGVVLFPSDVSLLHQFFSVVLSVQNGAPDGDPLQVRDLTAKARIPSGLRAAETDPPTPLGVPVPVRAPGPDGEVGTADDLNLLVAQATGEAEFLVEGLQEGTHIVEFDLQGVLEGMPGGPRPIAGHAKGAVVVRDPSLGVNVTHPETVRAGEAYTLGVTLSNLGNAPVNGASFNLPASGLAGVELAPGQGSSEQVPSLLPGESALVEFEMVPLINGRVIAGTARSGSALTPTFDFEVGIRNGVALSPNSLVMPSIVEELPAHLYRELISLVGLGHSLATAPPGGNPNAPRVGRGTVHRRVYRMVEASRVLALGESDFDAISVLAAEWLGARSQDWEWDTMRRSTDRGLTTTLAFADVLEAGSASTLDAFERFAAHQTHFGLQLAAAYGPGTTLEIESLTSGKRMAHHAPSGPIRDLPFADTFTLADGDLACLTQPEEAGYRALVRRDSAGTFGLRISLPAPAGGPGAMRSLEWSGVSLGAEGLAWVNFDSVSEAAVLEIDDNGDGFADRTELPSLGVLDARPFEVVAAVQNAELDPTGHVVDVLFSTEVDLNSLGEADRFEIGGKYSNGGLTLSERALQHGGSAGLQDVGLNSPRLVRVIFNNPLSAILPDPLMTVSGVVDGLGREISPQNVIVELRATDQAIQVHGQVIDPYGQPLPFADVFLEQWDLAGLGDELRCIKHRNAAVRADAEGFYRFDYVRQTACSDRYTLVAESPHGPHKGQIGGKVRFVGADEEVNIVMVGRGVISGRVTYDDGTVPTGLQVFAHNPVFESGRRAWVGSDGSYRMAEVTVGTVTLWAQDDQGNRVFQTLEVPVAGAEVSRDLVMLKRPDQAISRLSGTVIDFHSGEPEFNAYVALYVGGARINVTRTAEDGSFDFGVVPAGTAEVEAFDGATGRRGVQVTFQLAPDEDRSLALSLRDDRGTVEGYVRRQLEDGTVVPIPDAVVWAQGTPFNTTTDATGRYVLDEVFPGNRRVLAADLVANERTQTSVTVADGQIQQADLLFVDELDIQGGLSGQVLDEDGQPVSGATLHLAGGYWSSRWAHTANTDASGFYHFPDLEPGVYGIHAYRGSSGALEFGEIRFPGDVDNVTIRFKRGVIRGRTVVRESDGSLQGVLSQITYRTTNVHSQWGLVVVDDDFSYTETDGDGYFEIEALHGPYELFFYNPFHETGYRKVSGFLGPIDPDHQVEFKQNGSISGTVYLEDGVTPAAGADVALRGGGFSDYDLTTDADGRFTFDFVPPGRYHVTATLNQGVIYRTERVYAQMRRHGAEMDIDVVLQRQGRVEGTVLDAGGIAVPGAVVELRERGFPFRRLVRNADDNGQYAFDNIFEGELTLRAKAPDLGGLSGHEYADLVEEDEVVDTQITLEGAADIRGRVFNPENGEPVPNARVSVFGNGHLGAFVDSTQTDSDGYYEIRGLKLRDYGLRVFDPATGRRGLSPVFGLGHHEEVFEQDVTLEVRGTVQGHLYDPDAGNQGVPGATLQLHSQGIRWFKTYSSTGIDGEYSFEGIPEGDFDVRTFRNRRRAQGSGRIEQEDQIYVLDLYLARQSSLSIRVLAAKTGADDPGETVLETITSRVWESTGDAGIVGASLDNPAVFDPLRPRRLHSLVAREINGKRRVDFSFRLQPGEDRVKDLRVKAIGTVEVTTQTSTGAVLPGVNVELKNAFSYSHGVGADSVHGLGRSESHYGTSDAAGRVVFPNIWEGRYDVHITDPVSGLRGRGSGKLYWDGQIKTLTVKLQPSGTVNGTVFLSDGVTPAEGALVALDAAERSWQVQYAGADGSFAFTDIPLGSYDLIAQQADGPGTFELSGHIGADGEIDGHTLVLDDADPFVVDVVPPFGSQHIDRNSDVVVTFSEPIRPCGASCGAWVYLQEISSSTRPPIQHLWSANGQTLTLRPQSPLKNSTGYKLVVTRNLKDLARRSLAWRVVSSFYTADTVAPRIIDFRPRADAVQVPVTSAIEITFNESVDLTSLSGAFEVVDLTAGQSLTVTTQTSLDDRRVVLTPVVDFAPDRRIEVRVTGVADGAGNAMGLFTSQFWTPDETPPDVGWGAPSPGQVFTAGDAIDVLADITDNRGVQSVTLSLGDWSRSFSSGPYSWRIPAPVVTQAGPVEIFAEAVDIFGNVASGTLEVWVEPLSNSSPPAIAIGCPTAGDLVAPGVAQPVSFSALDDQALESAWLIVDGERVAELTPIWEASEDLLFEWTPEAGAAPGQVFLAALEARDFAGNVGSVPLDFVAPSGETLAGDQSLIPRSGALALAAGEFTVDSPLGLGDVTLLSGANLRAPEGAALAVDGLRVQCGGEARLARTDVLGDVTVEKGGVLGPEQLGHLDVVAQGITVEAGGLVDGRHRGYNGENGAQPPSNTGPWGPPGRAKVDGGSHGGRGTWYGSEPDGYDSVYVPTMAGGGGSRDPSTFGQNGGDGGGIVWLEASAELRIDGRVDVRGGDGLGAVKSSAGAGGSVRLAAQRLFGSGSVDAGGGARGRDGGGGGRVVLSAPQMELDTSTQVNVAGGIGLQPEPGLAQRIAGSGSLLVETAGSVYGTLILDGGDIPATPEIEQHRAAVLTTLGEIAVTATQVQGTDLLLYTGELHLEAWLGAFARLQGVGGVEMGTHRVLEVVDGSLLLEGAADHAAAVSVQGIYRFDRVEIRRARLEATDPIEVEDLFLDGDALLRTDVEATSLEIASGTLVRAEGTLTAGSMVLGDGAMLKPSGRSDLIVDVAGSLTVGDGAVIDTDAFGYGPGPDENNLRGKAPDSVQGSMFGGSHGGFGFDGADIGDIFGSVYYPAEKGGGGGSVTSPLSFSEVAGGDGGGIIHIKAGDLVLHGTLRANGRARDNGFLGLSEHGGAGGTVTVEAATLSGPGTIVAEGSWGERSAGGGGRVALRIGTFQGFDVASQVSAAGGVDSGPGPDNGGYGGAGTIFIATGQSTYGDLLVDAGGALGDRVGDTPLPHFGTHTVGAIESVGSDLWVTPQDSAARFDLGVVGMWARINGSDYRVAAQDPDRTRVLLEGAASAISSGDTVVGVYKFDRVTVTGAGRLIVGDVFEVAEVITEDGGTLDASAVTIDQFEVPAGSVVEVTEAIHAREIRVRGTLRTDATRGSLVLDAETLVVEPGGRIDQSGRGFLGGPGPEGDNLRGLTPAGVEGSRTGASHGGFGHLGDDHGEAYGSVYRPRFSGAGGGSFRKTSNTHTFRGGTGGGVVEIRADDMIVDGEIVANGVAGEEGDYGGAGGSLYLDVGRLSGSGELQALGADANKGAGAGGRIAIKVNELLGFDPATQVNAAGGVDTDQQSGGYGDGGRAGAGTIFLYTSASTYGELRVDARESGALTPDRTVLPSLGQHTIGMVEIDAGDPTHLWIEPQAPEGRFDLGVEGAWARVEGVDYRVLEESGDRRRVLLEGAAGSVQTGDGVRGVYKFDRLTLAGTAGVDAVDLIEAAVVVAAEDADLRAAWTDFVDLTVEPMATFVAQDPLTVENLTVRAGGALRSVEGRTLRLDVGHLDVESGAEVSASGLGFGGGGVNTVAGHAPDGVPGSLEAGSHGGLGRWADASSQTYGSIKRPRFAGGGGGEHGVGGCTGCPPLVGGSGGGVIEITAQTAHIDGAIRANGVPGQDNKRGGAGGTVFMEVGTLDGAGTIEARGGDGTTSGGGGGRVALITGSTTFDPASQTLVDSVSNGGAGTVYVRTAASTWGDLYVNGGASGQTLALTRLPSLGEHEIAATVVDTNDPSDLWIEVLEGKGDPSLGVEGQIAMVQGVGFEVLDQVDRRLILLDGASGFVEAGMLVEGLHVFDNIYVSGSADFTSLDAVDAAAWHVDPSLTPEWDPLGPGLENCGSGNLLTNPSAEMTTAGLPFDGWQVVSGPWEDSVGSGQHFGPADGTRFFWPGIGPSSVAATYELRQDVDLSGHGAAIDGGRAQAFVAATLIGLYGDGARLRVDYLDAAENVLESYTPPVHYEDRWLRVTDTRALPVATRTARVRLIAEKTWSGGQDVSTGFDALRLHVLPTPVVEVTGPGSLLETEVTADFSVALLCPRPYAVSASFATADLSAVAGSDFTAQSGALLFAAGETAKTVSVTLLDDAATEGPETFRLDVTSPDLVVATPSTVVTVLDDELGGLSLTLEDSHPSDGVYPGAEVVYTATLDHGGPALANARMTSVSSPELSVVPGSVVTSVGTVVSEQPLDIDLGSLASPSTVTVTFTAVLDVFPGGGSVNSHLLLTADGIEDVPSDDPATPAAVDDATETPVATVPTGFELTAGSRLEGSALELDVNFYDSSANESYTATLDWGDGSAVEVPSVAVTAAGGSFSASHVFVQDGTYPGQICITDASGHETCESHDFVVENVAPRPGWLDLQDWSVDDFRGTASNWGQDRFINVGQTADSGPTALLSPFPALGARVSGQWRAWADLGFMGFVLGYEPGESESSSADYLIAVWKRGNEGTARRGVRLYRVQGRVASFWDLDGSPQSTLLAEATTLADVGYEYETDYGFEVELLPGRFRLWIDDQLEIDVTDDFSSLGGSFGLYNLRHHSNLFKRVRVQAADTTLSGGVPLAPFPSRYDFRDFTKEESIEGTNPTATWNTQLAGRKVHQNTESRPSFLYSDEALGFRRVRGVMRINGDDGYIGLALGYNPGDVTSPDADYVLVVWKRNTTGAAAKGLRAYHVQGIPANYWTFDSQPLLTKLADSTNYGAVGFEYQKNYRFEAHLEPDRFRLWVNEELEIDVAGTFSDGRFSLFNNAMRQAIYNDWFIDGLAVDEGQATPEAYVGFTDPGLLDSHGSATVELDGQLSAATHGSSSGVVSVQVAGQTFDDDLLLDGDACVWDELDAGCGAVPIRVLNVAPSVTVPGVIASGPSTFELDGATFTDPGHLDIHTAEVDWGDGSAPASATVTFAGGAGTVDANHDYSANGTYTVTTCVTDDDGGEGCTSVTITVSGLSSGLVPTVKVNAPESAPGSSPEADAAAGVDLAAPNAGAAPGAQFSWVDPSEEE